VLQLLMVLWYRSQSSDMIGFLIWVVAEAMKLETGLMGEVFATPIFFECLITDMAEMAVA